MYGYDLCFLVNDNWDNLVDELLYYFVSLEQLVWGVGYFFGGVLYYYVVLCWLEFYCGVVMFDLLVLIFVDCLVICVVKCFGFIDWIILVGCILGCCEVFFDLEEVWVYFFGKVLFCCFDFDCLEVYVCYGLVDSGGGFGLCLCFDLVIEISIYCSVLYSSLGCL